MTREELEARYQRDGWHFWDGVSGLKYGRLKGSSPPRVVRAPDWDSVAAQIESSTGEVQER